MTDKVAPLTTEHLRIMRDDIAAFRGQMTEEFAEMKKRFRTQERHIVGLRRDEAIASEEITDLRHQIDTMLLRLKALEDRAAH